MTVSEIIDNELDKLIYDIKTRHIASGQQASGNTISSLEKRNVYNTGGQLWGNSYIGVLERGRKPGKVPKDFIDILKRWAGSKGISFTDEKQFNLWANGVKWKIIKEGTSLYRSGKTEDIFTTPISDFKDRLAKRLQSQMTIELTNKIFDK